jgi:predicted Zn-dependent protease
VGILLPFSRQQESEADLLGLRLMADAGFNPNGALRLWEAMGAQEGAAQRPPELLSTHPASTTRLATLRQALPGAQGRYDQARAAGRSPACQLL